MTPGERLVWAAVYAASWHQSTGGAIGVVGEHERARWAARQASRALDALKGVVAFPEDHKPPSLEQAAEVLGG